MYMRHLVLRIIFSASLLYLAITIAAFSIGQFIPIEFSDIKYRNLFYDIGFYGIPIATLLTLSGTLKNSDEAKRTVLKVWLTIFASGLSIVLLFTYILTLGFGAWTDQRVKFTNKENKGIRIVEQMYDIGAFGYGGQRTVKTIPLTPWFNYIMLVDTAELDRSDWIFVQKGNSEN
jgi:uncharacterized membrane protein